MSLVTPLDPAESCPTEADERSLDERVAELEGLIEEARLRARRRRQRNGAVAVLVALCAVALTRGGGDGVRVGAGRSADTSPPRPLADTQNVGRWSVPYGPPGDGVNAIVVDPKVSANVYAVAGGRVFRSADGGRSWTGGMQIDPRVDVVAVDPQRPATLYAGAGAGVFKSVDAGRSWTWSGLGQTPRLPGGRRGEGNVFSIVVDPTDGSVLYAVAGVTNGHVSKSTDHGRTWRTLTASPQSVSALAIDPADPQTLFAAVEGAYVDGKGHSSIAMTTNGGATWRTVLERDGDLWSIAVASASPGTVYAVGDSSVLVSSDGGLTWSARSAPAPYASGLVVDPRDPDTLYVGTWKKGVFRSSDGGSTWTSMGTHFTGPIALDPHAPSALYFGTEDGIAKTLDGGKTWRPADSGIVASSVLSTAVDPHRANVVYAATHGGLFRSDDRGRTWKAIRPGAEVQAVAVDPANSARVLASGTTGILISTDAGRTWSQARGSTVPAGKSLRTRAHVTEIVFDPQHTGVVYAAAWGAGVIRSVDDGRTWHTTARRPAWISSIAGTVAVAPGGSSTLYGSTNGALIRSADGGASWKWIFLPKIGAVVAVFAVDPSDPKTLYASIGDNSARHPRLARSTDGGKHWRFLKWGGGRYIDANALTIDPRRPHTMYVATRFEGVLRTTDGGASWRPFNAGLVARAITTVTLDRGGNTLYSGTDGAGVGRVRLH